MSGGTRALRLTCFRSRDDLAELAEDERVRRVFSVEQHPDLSSFTLPRPRAAMLDLEEVASIAEMIIGGSRIPRNLVVVQPKAALDEIAILAMADDVKASDLQEDEPVPLRDVLASYLAQA